MILMNVTKATLLATPLCYVAEHTLKSRQRSEKRRECEIDANQKNTVEIPIHVTVTVKSEVCVFISVVW